MKTINLMKTINFIISDVVSLAKKYIYRMKISVVCEIKKQVCLTHPLLRARKIAQEQQEKSQQTVKMAKEAEDLSTDALNTAKNARNTLKETQVRETHGSPE